MELLYLKILTKRLDVRKTFTLHLQSVCQPILRCQSRPKRKVRKRWWSKDGGLYSRGALAWGPLYFQILAPLPPPPSCVALGKSLNLADFLFVPLWNKDDGTLLVYRAVAVSRKAAVLADIQTSVPVMSGGVGLITSPWAPQINPHMLTWADWSWEKEAFGVCSILNDPVPYVAMVSPSFSLLDSHLGMSPNFPLSLVSQKTDSLWGFHSDPSDGSDSFDLN